MTYVDTTAGAEHSICFGGFTIDPRDRTLWLNGRRIPLGPRPFSLLKFLLDRRSRPVPKNELLENVWRGLVVEENNLQVQISTLRRLLGAAAIATIPGRGYRFMLPVDGDDTAGAAATPGARAEEPMSPGNLPVRVPEIYGRDDDCTSVCESIRRRTLVSIVGAAGIGKSALALTVASNVGRDYPDGAWLVELASLNDPRLLPQTIAQAMRMTLPGLRDAAEELCAATREMKALLVLDNCEHLLDEIGPLATALLRDSATVRLIVTSQEALRVGDECVFRVAPLPVPSDPNVAHPDSYGAVRLFVERVRSMLPSFCLDTSVVPGVVDICRRLDGLPLAIELAAARVPALGVDGVRERLDERFRILTGGSRVAPRRHQTLRAALDWSHSLLSDDEKAVYRRLGIFVGSFSLESAQQLAADDEIDEWAALEALNNLVDKSLVLVEGAVRPRYRLLESTREHALEQLAVAGETDRWMALHARATLAALQAAIRERRTDQVLAEMGNVRIAYRWAHDTPDAETAVALATLPAMALAVEGAVDESRERLLEVEPLVSDSVPQPLVALYWQWVGRIGLGGRLPASRCFQAFRRAEQMFAALGNQRHVHACRRQLAEAFLDVGNLSGARACIAAAKQLETAGWPVADTMRRLRVEGLCSAEAGSFDEALRTSERALEMAQGAAIDRYELVLLEDIARMHLERGDALEAARRYRTLAERARPMQNGGFTLAKALTGLIAALTAADDLDAAAELLQQSLPTIARSGNVVPYVDVFASLIARRGDLALAACLLAASDHFRDRVETQRVPIVQRCRDEVAVKVAEHATPELAAEWHRVGQAMSEADVVRSIAASLSAAPRSHSSAFAALAHPAPSHPTV